MTEFTTSADGTRIAYSVTGSGPALVLVDGAMCYREFGPCKSLAETLADRYTVYYYDRRGRGESGNTLPYSPEREFEDLAAVIDAAGGDAFVLGFSSGGGLVLRAAAHGVPMRKLASYEAPFIGEVRVKGQPVDAIAELNKRLDAGRPDKAVDFFMVDMVGGPAFMPLMMRLMRPVFAQLKAVAFTLPYDTEIMTGFRVPVDELSRIRVPALVMVGGKAKPNMVAAAQGVADAVPGATHRLLPGQTHQVKDEAIAPELVEFFR
ncbi:alpha/beta fold hydrolase [Salinibacterium soli]|uniref:Alpha/beta hydrolase n=1 Tax=Antiquaquibacter soli TaxID=3064523 RepID=A0ABT9BMZ3_9MICO|nr:alpha/beta hydrolase [Protaetiibacter sp. WY-16]MDO7882407.1 alpha/beta hydrolase [Protaetiibacter sp. WY-16]